MKELITIKFRDHSKRRFFFELMEQLDFLDFKVEKKATVEEENYDFFQSAGLFEHRAIDANQLRKEAWRINK